MKFIRVLLIGSICFFFPLTVFAHLISITATTPFPATVPAASIASATFTVTNISKINITAVSQKFPSDSGLSVTSSTCGSPLSPGQSCTIQIKLQAPTSGSIASELKVWAKPSADGVKYAINIGITPLPNIMLVPMNSVRNSLPALRDPIIATHAGNWLILSGSLGGFHDFNNNFNPNIYVFNPSTMQTYSVAISDTDLPQGVQDQISSSDPEFLQDGDTLYIIGGFHLTTTTDPTFTTLQTITSINVPAVMSAIMDGSTSLSQFVHFDDSSFSQFKVTGGQLGKIGNDFYLAYGQDCEGTYCGGSQIYTNSIYQFVTDPTLASTAIINSVTHGDGDGSGWRRRDYALAPFMLGNTETLFALGGPFTPGDDAFVWTNGINFNANLEANSNFINQQGNQYTAPYVSMYSASTNMSYVATFSGLSNLYWSTSGLVYDNSTPYGNILDLISSDAASNVQEYVNLQPLCSGQPLPSCLYMGLSAEFVPVANYYDDRKILQLDQLPANTSTLIGYIYAGLLSPVQDIFGNDESYPTNTIYAVYLNPTGSGSFNWKNVTNLFPGN